MGTLLYIVLFLYSPTTGQATPLTSDIYPASNMELCEALAEVYNEDQKITPTLDGGFLLRVASCVTSI